MSNRMRAYSTTTQIVWKSAYWRMVEMGEAMLAPNETEVVTIERLDTCIASLRACASTLTSRSRWLLHGICFHLWVGRRVAGDEGESTRSEERTEKGRRGLT